MSWMKSVGHECVDCYFYSSGRCELRKMKVKPNKMACEDFDN